MNIEWRTVTIGTFSVVFECQSCGALCWGSGQSIHEKFHEGLAMTASQANHADAMTRPIGGTQ